MYGLHKIRAKVECLWELNTSSISRLSCVIGIVIHAGTSLQQSHDKLNTLPLCSSLEARITSTVVVDGRYESLVIWGGQIASLGPPAICRPAKLIPLHWMGLPGSYPTTLHPTRPHTRKNIAHGPLRHINTDIDLHYIRPELCLLMTRSVVADLH